MPAATKRPILRRILRLRCPQCGNGRIFRSHFVRANACSHCGWRFEREAGFWVGGAEVHMFLSYGLSVLLFVPVLILFGDPVWVKVGAIAGHALLSLLLFRWSRAAFIGIDYLIDPDAGEARDDGHEGGEEPAFPRRRPPSPHAARRRRLPVSH